MDQGSESQGDGDNSLNSGMGFGIIATIGFSCLACLAAGLALLCRHRRKEPIILTSSDDKGIEIVFPGSPVGRGGVAVLGTPLASPRTPRENSDNWKRENSDNWKEGMLDGEIMHKDCELLLARHCATSASLVESSLDASLVHATVIGSPIFAKHVATPSTAASSSSCYQFEEGMIDDSTYSFPENDFKRSITKSTVASEGDGFQPDASSTVASLWSVTECDGEMECSPNSSLVPCRMKSQGRPRISTDSTAASSCIGGQLERTCTEASLFTCDTPTQEPSHRSMAIGPHRQHQWEQFSAPDDTSANAPSSQSSTHLGFSACPHAAEALIQSAHHSSGDTHPWEYGHVCQPVPPDEPLGNNLRNIKIDL